MGPLEEKINYLFLFYNTNDTNEEEIFDYFWNGSDHFSLISQ